MSSKEAVVAEEEATPITHIKSTHLVSDWRPAKLLCKRFNIRDPYKQLPDVDPTETKPKGTTVDELFTAKDKQQPHSEVAAVVDLDLEELEKEFVDPLQNVKKADIDLFSELFGFRV